MSNNTTGIALTGDNLDRANKIISELEELVLSASSISAYGVYLDIEGAPIFKNVVDSIGHSYKVALFSANNMKTIILRRGYKPEVIPISQENAENISHIVTSYFATSFGQEFNKDEIITEYFPKIKGIDKSTIRYQYYDLLKGSARTFAVINSDAAPYIENIDDGRCAIKIDYTKTHDGLNCEPPAGVFYAPHSYCSSWMSCDFKPCKKKWTQIAATKDNILITEIPSEENSIVICRYSTSEYYNPDDSFKNSCSIDGVTVISLAKPTFNFNRVKNTLYSVDCSSDAIPLPAKGDFSSRVALGSISSNEPVWKFLSRDICRKMGLFDFSIWGMKSHTTRIQDLLAILQIMADNSVVESLIKQRQKTLVNGIVQNIKTAMNKDHRREKMKKISDLFYTDSKGIQRLRLPNYVSSFLDSIDTPANDYLAWADFIERTHMDKNQFEKFIQTSDFLYMISNLNIRTVASILSYDVDLIKYIRYVEKQEALTNNISIFYNYLDYCEMCTKKIGKDFNRFPSSFIKAHDEVSRMKSSTISGKYDIKIKELADKYQTTFKNDNYVIVMPKCEDEILAEAISQNNCLADYIDKIGKQETIIFFIRKKDYPDQSFVTAQVDFDGNLIQIRRRNELPVEDNEVLNLARMFCNHVKIQAKKIS